MFENVGGKIKIISKVFFWLVFIASSITGLIFIFNRYTWWIGLIIIVIGFLSSWIASLFLYGFGELIDKTTEIAYMQKNKTSALAAFDNNIESETPKKPNKIIAQITSDNGNRIEKQIFISDDKYVGVVCTNCGSTISLDKSAVEQSQQQICPKCNNQININII